MEIRRSHPAIARRRLPLQSHTAMSQLHLAWQREAMIRRGSLHSCTANAKDAAMQKVCGGG